MSIKKEYEVKTHTVTEMVCVKETMYCDVCGNEMNKYRGYWDLTTGHHDWGNDSADSIEHFDVCSEACLRVKFDEYIGDSAKNNHNTLYFRVHRA